MIVYYEWYFFLNLKVLRDDAGSNWPGYAYTVMSCPGVDLVE